MRGSRPGSSGKGHQVEEHARALEVTEEADPEAGAGACSWDEARNVGDDEGAVEVAALLTEDDDHAEVRLEGGEWGSRRFRGGRDSPS